MSQYRRKPRRSYAWTAAQDTQLARVYSGGRFNRGVLQALATEWGVEPWVPSYRAQQLGLSRERESSGKIWTPGELAIMERNAHLTAHVVARKLQKAGFVRSANSVMIKRRKQRLNGVKRGYSAHELAECFGVTAGDVCNWIKRGLLEAKPRKDSNAGGNGDHPWLIRGKAVRDFVVNHTSLVRIGRVEKFWFVDLLTNTHADKDGGSV